MRLAVPCLLALLLAACATTSSSSRLSRYLDADECSARPGFAAFHAELVRISAARDGAAFRALFHPDGAMRVEGIGGRGATPDWGFGRPEAAAVWRELDELLPLGCVLRDGKAMLPAMAGPVEDGTVEPEYDMALVDLAVHARMDDASPVLLRARAGDLLQAISYPDDWVEVLVGGERTGYVRAAQIRSPHSYQLVAVEEAGRWYLKEFTSGV
jgi:hypothetical protein